MQLVIDNPSDSDHKGVSAGSACQTGGLGIEERQPVGWDEAEARITSPIRQPFQGGGDLQGGVAMWVSKRVTLLNDKSLTQGGLKRVTVQDFL
jgi:hypothetical protein